MSLFGSLMGMGDMEDDPIFGSHMRHMRQMNNMMNSLFSDPFGMFGVDSPLAIGGPRHGSALMPFMPQMPSLDKLLSGHMERGGAGTSFSSSTVVMSGGPYGKPQVFSSTSSTKIGPNGIKETRKTLQDSRTGTKKMSIGHHIGERAHVIEREQNYYSGDAEERQEFINIDEDEAEDFDREFQMKAGAATAPSRYRSLPPALAPSSPAPQRLALPPAPSTQAHSNSEDNRRHSRSTNHSGSNRSDHSHSGQTSHSSHSHSGHYRPSARRPLRTTASPLTTSVSGSVRDVYSGAQPNRPRHKHHKHQQREH